MFDTAATHGLGASTVRNLRDAAVTLGMEVGATGRIATKDQLDAVFNRYKVPESARPDLVKLWRSLESGS